MFLVQVHTMGALLRLQLQTAEIHTDRGTKIQSWSFACHTVPSSFGASAPFPRLSGRTVRAGARSLHVFYAAPLVMLDNGCTPTFIFIFIFSKFITRM